MIIKYLLVSLSLLATRYSFVNRKHQNLTSFLIFFLRIRFFDSNLKQLLHKNNNNSLKKYIEKRASNSLFNYKINWTRVLFDDGDYDDDE